MPHLCMGSLLCIWSLLALIPACLLAVPSLIIQKKRYFSSLAVFTRRMVTGYGRITLFLLRPWMPVHTDDGHHARAAGPCIIVANHQSFLDLYLLGAQEQANLCLASKAWPYRLLFFFAPIMRLAGYVDVESLPLAEAEDVCLRRLREGATLVFFPEGQRSRDGRLGRFHAGAFALAVRAGVPLVPLVIHNSRSVFPPGGKFLTPAEIHLRMLAPFHASDFAHEDIPHRAMMRRVRGAFALHLQTPSTQGETS